MTEEEILALIAKAIAPLNESIQGIQTNTEKAIAPLVQRLQAIGESVTALEEQVTSPVSAVIEELPLEKQGEDPAVLALKAQIAKLEESQKAAEDRAKAAQIDALMKSAIAKSGTKHPGLMNDVLRSRFGSSVFEDKGSFYVKGDAGAIAFDDAVNAFFGSEEGKALLPATTGSGVGIQQGGSNALSAEKPKPKSAAEAFEALYNR